MSLNDINYSQVANEYKSLHFGDDNINALLKGIKVVRKAVAGTMGAHGKTVIIHDGTKNKFRTTKDGVSVAKSIHLKDPVENIGANQLKEIAKNVVDIAGDGTTTATVITAALCETAVRLRSEGVKTLDITLALGRLGKIMSEHFDHSVKYIGQRVDQTPDEEVKSIARIAANFDEEITNLVYDAIKNTGEFTVINVEQGSSDKSYIEDIKGYSIDRGYLNSNFKDPNRLYVEHRNPLVFVTTEELVGSYDVERMMTIAAEEARPLVIIAKDFLQDAYNYIAMNRLHSSFPVLPIKAPRFGDEQKLILEDIAMYTGATLASTDKGFTFSMIEIDDFGECDLIKSGSDYTNIIGGHSNGLLIDERIEALKDRLHDLEERDQHEHFIQSVKERISKLSDGICTIYVGGFTEQEIKEKFDRVEDSLQATTIALEHGYLVGGGLFYKRIASMIRNHPKSAPILKELALALYEPNKTILKNAMLEDNEITIQEAQVSETHMMDMYAQSKLSLDYPHDIVSTFDQGIDVKEYQIVNFLDNGIIDTAASTKAIIDNAIAFTKTFINTHCTIIHELEYFKNIQ